MILNNNILQIRFLPLLLQHFLVRNVNGDLPKNSDLPKKKLNKTAFHI